MHRWECERGRYECVFVCVKRKKKEKRKTEKRRESEVYDQSRGRGDILRMSGREKIG